MTNREFIEYMLICKGRVLFSERVLEDESMQAVLDSSASIKNLYEKVDKISGIGFNFVKLHIIKLLKIIFRDFKTDEEREWALKTFCDVIDSYNLYFDDGYTMRKFVESVNVKLNYYKSKVWDKEIFQEGFKILPLMTHININGEKYYTAYKMDEKEGYQYISIGDKKCGAILFKDKKIEFKEVQSEKDWIELTKELKKFDYDLALTATGTTFGYKTIF